MYRSDDAAARQKGAKNREQIRQVHERHVPAGERTRLLHGQYPDPVLVARGDICRSILRTRHRAKGNKDTSRYSLCSFAIASVRQVQVAHGCQDLLQR